MEHICYVLYSIKCNKIYVGYTSSLIERIRSHNSKNNKGYTKTCQPWIVAHLEVFQSKREAMIREKQLKSSRGRFQIWGEIIPRLVGLIPSGDGRTFESCYVRSLTYPRYKEKGNQI